MFQRLLSFLGLILLFSCVYGCSDEYMSQPVKTVFFTPPIWLNTAPADGTIGPVPEDLANLLWGDLDNLIATFESIPPNQPRDYYIIQIAEIREHRAFYGKYINAGGVAILGNADLEDVCFYTARDIVLGMTSKMPELREHLSPIEGDRVNLTGLLAVPDSEFRMVIHDPAHSQDIPERQIGQVASLLGSCGLEFCHATTAIYVDHNGNTQLKMTIFIHEFAHAIHRAINLVDATFSPRLAIAYEAAKENDDSYWGAYQGGVNSAEANAVEYWAHSSTRWFSRFPLPTGFGEYHHTLFRENDPLLYELLTEVYDFQYLGDIEVKLYR